MSSYDRQNWCQVWLAMPGEGPQSSALFWFRVTSSTHVFPFGNVLAHDAALFFATSIGWTTQNYNHGSYVHAYLSTTDFGFPLETHGYAPFPFIPPPPVDVMPVTATITVRNRTTPRIQQSRWSMAYTPRSWVSGRHPNASAAGWLSLAQANYLPGWASQGRVFQPVVVSYLHRQWYDLEGWELSTRLGGRHRRQQVRKVKLVGNVPKPLP